MSPRDIHQCLDSSEIVSLGSCAGLHGADRCHRIVKNRSYFWIPRKVVEYRCVKNLIKGWHTRFYAVAQHSPRPPGDVMSRETSVPSKALRMIAPKQLPHIRKSE